MKRFLKKMMSLLLTVVLSFGLAMGLAGCEDSPWAIEERRLFSVVNEIPKNPDYVLINDFEYRSAEKTVIWKEMIMEKVKADGKKIEGGRCIQDLYLKEPNTLEGGFVVFAYQYSTEFPWFGLNVNNNNYAIGTIFLDDFSFEINYISLPYSQCSVAMVSETHFCCYVKGTVNKKEWQEFLLINRANGKAEKTWKSLDEATENFQGAIAQNYNQRTYTENGVDYRLYLVDNTRIENKELKISIDAPSYEYVLERSEELQQIDAEMQKRGSIQATFITNGTELFVVFTRKYSMFGADSHISPIVFRCDTTKETFEYIGCMHSSSFYPKEIVIIKTN
jgi:hypothetical protein